MPFTAQAAICRISQSGPGVKGQASHGRAARSEPRMPPPAVGLADPCLRSPSCV